MRVSAGRSDAILRLAGTSPRSDTTPWGRGLRAPPMAAAIGLFGARSCQGHLGSRCGLRTGPWPGGLRNPTPACRRWSSRPGGDDKLVIGQRARLRFGGERLEVHGKEKLDHGQARDSASAAPSTGPIRVCEFDFGRRANGRFGGLRLRVRSGMRGSTRATSRGPLRRAAAPSPRTSDATVHGAAAAPLGATTQCSEERRVLLRDHALRFTSDRA